VNRKMIPWPLDLKSMVHIRCTRYPFIWTWFTIDR
jgi:hypothetical protein